MYLGIDLGTSGVKVIILSREHDIVGSASAGLEVSRPQPLWSEQSPEDWWLALNTCMLQLKASHAVQLRQVRGIGLSGQMHGAVLMDADDQILRPCILWNDGRSFEQCQQLESAILSNGLRSRVIAGNLAMPGFTAPKLLWVKQNEPELFTRIRHVLLPKDWLRWKITGQFVSEMSDASGTLWLDIARREWSEPLLAATSLSLGQMPRLIEGSHCSGYLQQALAKQWGLPNTVLVAGGAGDNAASAIGVGAVSAGQGFVSLGTSGVSFLVGSAYRSAPEKAVHAFAHALPNTWHQMSVMLSAASAISWACAITQVSSAERFLGLAESLPMDRKPRAPLFLPYLSGERTPHNNPHATAMFSGLTAEHGLADIAYAVVEGVCFGMLDGFNAMQSANREELLLDCVGGGAHSQYFTQIMANVLGCRLRRDTRNIDAAALGAARLAWLADGASMFDVAQVAPSAEIFEPIKQDRQHLVGRFAQFQQLYSKTQT